MRIKGKLNLQEMKEFLQALGVALVLAIVVLLVFMLLTWMHWMLSWMVIAVLLTPVVFYVRRFFEYKIEIVEDSDDENSLGSIV